MPASERFPDRSPFVRDVDRRFLAVLDSEIVEERVSLTSVSPVAQPSRGRFASHLSLCRFDHSVKQIFVLPGVIVAASLTGEALSASLVLKIALGLLAVVAVASSNYVLNELLDAPFDRHHPTKCMRPAALGLVSVRLGYLQWLAFAGVGFLLALSVSRALFLSVLSLWIMGCLYNIPPMRMKDIPYLDVLSESINNPIRFCVGWYIVTSTMLPPVSLLVAYWMLGAYFMALKRFSEYREIGRRPAMKYRKSFAFYNEQALLTSIIFYAVIAMLFFGAFVMRYRIEMVLAFPLIAVLMAAYFNIAFMQDSPVQNPEKLYREPRIMVLLGACGIVLVITSFVHVQWLREAFPRSHARPATHSTDHSAAGDSSGQTKENP